jgi:hypothetical protein
MSKPPLGVKPKFIWLEERVVDLCDGIHRLRQDNLEVDGLTRLGLYCEELKEVSAMLLRERNLAAAREKLKAGRDGVH